MPINPSAKWRDVGLTAEELEQAAIATGQGDDRPPSIFRHPLWCPTLDKSTAFEHYLHRRGAWLRATPEWREEAYRAIDKFMTAEQMAGLRAATDAMERSAAAGTEIELAQRARGREANG